MEQNQHAKLKNLLINLTSIETHFSSDASKEFIKILNSEKGTEFIRFYIAASSKLVEISQAWETHKGKNGFIHVLDLLSSVFKHCKVDSGFEGGVNVCRSLDKFARVLIDEKFSDLYNELNSKDGKRQSAALLFLASIVKRNAHLAWEVTKVFDFKLSCFPKLAEVRLRVGDVRRRSFSTRKAFVGFAMAFLEVGHPRLLRSILQQKEMYSGVLRGLGNDEEETVVYVLSVLRDRVLVPESLVPPGLRSVLFGSVTLEQLVVVSGREDFEEGAELAYDVLVMVCTDPVNGLMPDLERQPSPLRGNVKRLLDLMKKLKATEVKYHKDLLRAVVKGRPSFGSAYLDEFPYNLEDVSSVNWFAAISLAADVVSSVREGLSLSMDKLTGFDAPVVQDIVKCIGPRPFTRLVINKGLLHSDTLVKHGTLRLVLEALQLLDILLSFVSHSSMSNRQKLKEEIRDGVRMSLPDPQVLLSLLSPLPSHFKCFKPATKRKAETEGASVNDRDATKRRKSCIENDDMDIVVVGVGVSSLSEVDLPRDEIAENGSDHAKDIGDIWSLRECSTMSQTNITDGDTYFYSKVLDTIAAYYRTMPVVLEGLFDLFKHLPSNPLSAPTILLESLLNLLVEHVNQIRTHPLIYKHLQPFLALLFYSPVRKIKEHAYHLAKESMLSTGAFENNPSDICMWFLFIPGYNGFHPYVEDLEVEIFQQLSSVVVSFLCDAVTATGNNLYKYMELLMHYINDANVGKDLSPEVSPFIICVLEKCFRLLSSESGSFTLPQKSLISLYICNTIKYILDTQVNVEPLSFLLDRVLTEKFDSADLLDLVICPCEWRPLKALLVYVRKLLNREPYGDDSNIKEPTGESNSFANTISDIQKAVRDDYNNVGLVGLAVGFSFSLICTHHNVILKNIPSILSISNTLLKAPLSVLASMLFLDSTYHSHVCGLWPEMELSGLGSVGHVIDEKEEAFDFSSTETASVAFASFLKRAPVCLLFSFAVHNSNLRLFEQSAVRKLILDKMTELPSDYLVKSFCNILFWMYRLRSCSGLGSMNELETVSKLCSVLTKHLLQLLLVQNVDTINLPQYAVEVADIILNHPVVTASLESPLYVDKDFTDSMFEENMEMLLESVKQRVNAMDHHILTMLKTISETLLPICNGQSSDHASNGCKRILRAFNALIHTLVMMFKSTFDGCVESGDFKPLVLKFHALHTLIHLIPPFELLELVNWLFSRIDLQSKGNALFVCMHLASCTFDILSAYSVLAGTDETHSDASSLFERIYVQVLEIAYNFKLDLADFALLKAVKVVKLRKVDRNTRLPFVMVLSRVIANAHVNIVSHCMNRVTKTKAELLYRIAEISPLHLSVFGYMFSEILTKSYLQNPNSMQEASFSDQELVMLLPTVFLYLKLVISEIGEQVSKPLKCINSVYGRILIVGFGNWKNFVSGDISEIVIDETLPTSMKGFSDFFSDSLLGKAILMVRDYLSSNEHLMNLENRLSLFSSLCPNNSERDDIFGHGIGEVENYSHKQALEFVNKVIAKINLCRILLFPDDPDQEIKSEMKILRVSFLRVLINSWRSIIKKLPVNIDSSGNIEDNNLLPFQFLETFTMKNICDLTLKMCDCIVKLNSIPFIEQLVKSFLRYRFNDHITMKMVRTVLASLSDGKFSCASIIQLVLGHSRFAKSIQLAGKSIPSTLGLIFTPMPSILRSLVIPHIDLNTHDCESSTMSTSQQHLLELVKLVRVLFHIYKQQTNVEFGEDTVIKSRELVYLLLSSYGATCSEIDMQIYGLIQERELNDSSCAGAVARIHYQWGIASLKAMEYLEKDIATNSVDSKMIEGSEENQRIQFRENLLVDPKLCAQTVLYFPHSRFVNGGTFETHQKYNSTFMQEVDYPTVDKLHIYDPVFILRFSIHCLSMGYIEPIEFASLGLLAISFVSISSPDDDMRKLGYEVLAKFKSALEKCRKKKEVKRLLLLLSYLQNGVQEPWQWIPSVITVFLAEASLVLLNSLNENYSTIIMHLMNSPNVNLKTVPLFQKMFWSTSINSKADRLWMLRLLYSGLNTEDDAQIYIKSSIFDTLTSFYSSPLSDNDSKELIIQIVKKSVQFHKTIRLLVEHRGLILWLSSIVSSLCGNESQEGKKFTLKVLPTILEVVKCITSQGNMVLWLQEHALEQLAELSSHVYKFIVGCIKLVKEQTYICDSILQILISVLKISHKRKTSQSHFTLSFEGLYNLYEVVEACSKTKCNTTRELGLEAVLTCSPPVTLLQMDKAKLMNFLSWAVTTAIWSESTKVLQPEESDFYMSSVSGGKTPVVSLVSKLLRWLTASVILGKFSCKLSKINSRNFTETMSQPCWESLLECHEKGFEEDLRGVEDILALSIYYLLQLTGFGHSLLPIVVPALCLLHCGSNSESLDALGSLFSSLGLKIQSSLEATSAWTWSYDSPWREGLLERKDAEKLDEVHACRKLLVVVSSILSKKTLVGSQPIIITLEGVDDLGVYDWERSLLQS